MLEIKAYKCEHCFNKVYQLKSSAKRHEKKCYWNKKNKACMTCVNYLEPDENSIFKVVEENTICVYANDNTGLNYNCKGWIEFGYE
jgi:hypothetical protein